MPLNAWNMRTQLLRWVLLVTLAEAVGFSVPTAVGTVVTRASWGPVATLSLPVRRWWIVATSLGTVAIVTGVGMGSAHAAAHRDRCRWGKIIIEE
jgi:hypothetical protein